MRHPIDIEQHVKHDHTRPHEGHTKWQGTTAAARAWVRRSGSTPAAAQSCWRCSLGTSSRLHRHTRCELHRTVRKRERIRLCKVSRSDHKAPEHRAETAQTDKSTTPAGAAPTRAPTTLVHTGGYRNGSRKQALARPSNTPCDCLKPACDCLKPALQPPLHAYRLYGRAPAEHAQQGQRH